MAGLDAFEATTLFFFLVSWWINPFDTNGTSSKVMRKRYRNFKAYTKFLPGWLFGPIWFILYTIMAISMWLYFNYASTEKHDEYHHYYDAILGLMIAHYILNKLWTMLFFTMQNYWMGAIDASLIFLTGLTLEILVWIHNNGDHKDSIYAAGSLLIPYVIWTLYAAILSIDIALNNTSISFFGLTKEMVNIHKGDFSGDKYPVSDASECFKTDGIHERGLSLDDKEFSRDSRYHRRTGQQRRKGRVGGRQRQPNRNITKTNGW